MSEQQTASFDVQVSAFHSEIVEMIKKYQFRDRSRICCFGVSVSQCYILESLHRLGPLGMNELAEQMHLSVSTLTRVAGQLVEKGYVSRQEGSQDRRRRVLALTESGILIFQKMWGSVLASEKEILGNFPEKHRHSLIQLLRELNHAIDQWRVGCC